jgi:F-type H+-transporting ATPase subunit delta
MSNLATLARPYAKAAFGLARDTDALAAWDEMLGLAGRITAEDAMKVVLESPHVTSDRAVAIIVEAGAERFDRRFGDFLRVLGHNGRLPLLPEISRLFSRLRQAAERRLQVRVLSAVPLDEGQAERMRIALQKRFDSEIVLENEVDASVIGGAIVYAGDQVIDGSLRGRLNKLQNSLSG